MAAVGWSTCWWRRASPGALIGSPAVAAAAVAPAAGAQAARSPGLATTIRPGLFEGVSCARAAACTAVGETPAEASLVERWNGLAWAGQTTPTGGPLVAVSCPSKTACTALGMTAGALAWNGTRWARQSVPIPQANGSRLSAVSCTAATACTAVGWYDTPAVGWYDTRMSWRSFCGWAGGTARHGPARPLRARPPRPSMSCTSATACTAVGDRYSQTGSRLTLSDRWNGTAWAIQPT